MRKEFLVYQNKVYSNFVNYINDYILLSKDPAMLEEGYVPYSFYVCDAGEGVYGKLVPYSEVSQRYSVYDVFCIKVRNLQWLVTSVEMMILQHPILMCEYWFLIKNF